MRRKSVSKNYAASQRNIKASPNTTPASPNSTPQKRLQKFSHFFHANLVIYIYILLIISFEMKINTKTNTTILLKFLHTSSWIHLFSIKISSCSTWPVWNIWTCWQFEHCNLEFSEYREFISLRWPLTFDFECSALQGHLWNNCFRS